VILRLDELHAKSKESLGNEAASGIGAVDCAEPHQMALRIERRRPVGHAAVWIAEVRVVPEV